MSTLTRVSELLLRWQHERDRGQPISVESLCNDCPELADEVRRRISAIEAMEAMLHVGPDGEATTAPEHNTEPSSVPDLPGYEIVDALNQGGMGIVYRARQKKLGRLVALKMTLAGPQVRLELRARFAREAEAMARLQHSNIVSIYEVGEHAGRLFFAMELLEGGSLARKLQTTLLPAREAADLLRTIARAVQHGHDRGIVHRDLKPGNVLLTGDGTPKISDFGLARLLHDAQRDTPTQSTQSGAVLGTASYMAPEQAAGAKDVGPAADVYALGAILYEMLTGRPPFRGETTLDTLEQVRREEPVPPSRLRARVPRDLETICLKCLEKDPVKRYASAAALADDLGRFVASEPILARPTPVWRKAIRLVRRQPVRATLVVSALVLLVVWARFTVLLHERTEYADAQGRVAQQQGRIAQEQGARAKALLRRALDAIDQHARATENAKMASVNRGDPGAVLFQLAGVYAQASAAMTEATDLKSFDCEALAARYAARAVELLESARQLGYFRDPAQRRRLEAEKELDPVRGRADFDRIRRLILSATRD